MMNFRTAGLWIFGLGFVITSVNVRGSGDSLRETLKTEHEAGRFDGVALVARNESVLGEFAFGLANRQFQVAHRADEPFPVASVTKQWLAVMVLQLVEAGNFTLDDSLSARLPSVDKPWARKITLRQLLTHTSGLPQPEAVIPDFYQRADVAPNATALAKLLAAKDPEEAPGLKFSYNNSDYMYLSAVLETVRGNRFPKC